MNSLVKPLLTISASVLVFSSVFASQHVNSTTDEHVVTAYKDCEIVYQKALTPTQLNAYTALQEQEESMRDLEFMTTDLEAELDQYTSELEAITELAIKETEDSLYIDKNLLKQQKQISERLASFMEKHKHKYEALGEKGKTIGKFAKVFSSSIESDLEGLNYDHIRITTPDDSNKQFSCYSDGVQVSL